MPTHRISLAVAEAITAASRRRADELGVPVTIAVLDHTREAVLVTRLDGCPPMPATVAVAKAFTSCSLGLDNDAPMEATWPGGELFGLQTTERLPISTIGGGRPLVVDGFIAGAVGVSGGSVEVDKDIAAAGVTAWQEDHA